MLCGDNHNAIMIIWQMLFRSFFFFKQKTAYEIKECDWSSDVCSSDLIFHLLLLYLINNHIYVL